MSISIVIPCYNEEDVIEKVVRIYCGDIISKISDSELIAIDDRSTDDTYKILKKLSSEFPQLKVLQPSVNGGHGKAIRMGYEAAEKEYVFQVDSDDQFEAEDFWKLYALKDDYDFILGFRKIRHDPLPRLLLTKIIRLMNLILFGVWLKDANCPFRLIRKEVLDVLLKDVDKNALAPNILISILAKKRRVKMKNVAVTHYERKTGVVSIAKWKLIKFSLRGLGQIISLRIGYKKGVMAR